MTFAPFNVQDPLDLEIEPGFPVRNLKSAEECASALIKLDMDIESIIAQIGRSEADPDYKPKGWRTRAQSAIRWKKRVRKAIVTYASVFSTGRPQVDDKRQAILATIEQEIGEAEFERLVSLAKDRHPHLPWATP